METLGRMQAAGLHIPLRLDCNENYLIGYRGNAEPGNEFKESSIYGDPMTVLPVVEEDKANDKAIMQALGWKNRTPSHDAGLCALRRVIAEVTQQYLIARSRKASSHCFRPLDDAARYEIGVRSGGSE